MRPMSEASSWHRRAGAGGAVLGDQRSGIICSSTAQPSVSSGNYSQRNAIYNPETGCRKCGPREMSWKTGRLLRPSLIAKRGLEGCEQEAKRRGCLRLLGPPAVSIVVDAPEQLEMLVREFLHQVWSLVNGV